jgi:RHS repeat-associated protein
MAPMRGAETALIARASLVILMIASSALRCVAATQTTTTTYQYNADGALTAVTTQIDAQTASTVYLTWDNFVPALAGSTGTVQAGDGNLLGYGPTPGSGFTTQFEYDSRDRLTSAATTGAQSTSYTYHPAGLMASSTLATGDALQFYYNAASLPDVTNIVQASTGTSSSYLPGVSYLSDGTEQMRCQPRKDTAGVYEATQQSFTPNLYDPYGVPESGTAVNLSADQSYDLHQNPFLYAGEYRDPAWGGYYLRERWYLSELQTFLSRDPFDELHRYSYTGGNPIGRVDPSGRSYHSFSRSVDSFLKPVNTGILGDTLPIIPIYGQVVGGVTLLANLPRFWHSIGTRSLINFAFLGASVDLEGLGELPVFDRWLGASTAFRGRIGLDVGVGVGQTVLAGDKGHGKWGPWAMVQSAEFSFSNIVTARSIDGFGYRPHSLSAPDVAAMAAKHFAGGAPDDMLVFRVRNSDGPLPLRGTSPYREWRTIGGYHESVVAVAKDWSLSTEVTAEDAGTFVRANVETRWNTRTAGKTPYMRDKQMMFVGTFRRADVEQAFGLQQEVNDPASNYNLNNMDTHVRGYPQYRQYKNNCHDYVMATIGSLQGR